MAESNKDIDLVEFAANVSKTVDSIRSYGKSGSGPESEPIESRVNAFYRALGLPAINYEGKEIPKNNGNFFKVEESADVGIIFEKIMYREIVSKKLSSDVLSGEISSSLDVNESTVTDSINPDKKSRPQLFPMFVLDDIEIYPKDKRVAGAFMTRKERVEDKTEYFVPFVEFIVSLKLKSEGVFDVSKQGAVSSEMGKEFKSVFSDISKAMLGSLESLSDSLSEIKSRIDKVRLKSAVNVVPSRSGIANQNIKTIDVDDSLLSEDLKEANQERELAIKQARLLIMGYDDTAVVEEYDTRNFKKAIFASQFLDLAVSDSGAIERAIDETKKTKDKIKAELKQANSELYYILGTFSGLSCTDVMAVLYTMFDCDKDILISLLNDDALNRLNKAFGQTYTRKYPMFDAVAKLEEEVASTINNKIVPEMLGAKIK